MSNQHKGLYDPRFEHDACGVGFVVNIDGKNLLSVRVYDGKIYGGIYDGPIGITTRKRFQKWQKKKKSFFDFIFE